MYWDIILDYRFIIERLKSVKTNVNSEVVTDLDHSTTTALYLVYIFKIRPYSGYWA